MAERRTDRGPVRVGYCTNVHAGSCLDDVLANLDRHAAAVRASLLASPETAAWAEPMDVGLWLPMEAARRVRTERVASWLRGELAARGMRAFTFNGFPYEDFHRPTVKRAVYRPGWDDPRRLAYTRDLVEIMAAMHDPGASAGVSTVPITWRAWCDEPAWTRAISHLRRVALHCAEVERRTGVCVHVDLEPEPGCALDRAIDVVRLFEDRLLPGLGATDEAAVRRHLRVCHDACHAAVMFDGQAASMDRLAAAGIAVGKIQISSAIDVDFAGLDAGARAAAIERLRSFDERRYLHQVAIRHRQDGPVRLIEDLGPALDEAEASPATLDGARWRVHFHVPVHVERIDPLGTTQTAIDECLSAAVRHGVHHLEVETYAWTVLPEAMRPDELADGIAAELAWVLDRPGLQRLVRDAAGPADAAPAPAPSRAAAIARLRATPVEVEAAARAEGARGAAAGARTAGAAGAAEGSDLAADDDASAGPADARG